MALSAARPRRHGVERSFGRRIGHGGVIDPSSRQLEFDESISFFQTKQTKMQSRKTTGYAGHDEKRTTESLAYCTVQYSTVPVPRRMSMERRKQTN
jgi:hypothetical protein